MNLLPVLFSQISTLSFCDLPNVHLNFIYYTFHRVYLPKDLQGGCEVVVAGTLIDWCAAVKIGFG